MAAFSLVSFDGYDIGCDTEYEFILDARDQYVRAASVALTGRSGTYPTVDSTSLEARSLIVRGVAGASVSAEVFRETTRMIFDPARNQDGPRDLIMVGDDGITEVRIGCYVTSIEYTALGLDQYAVTLIAPNPVWQAVTPTVSAANPANVTNNGNTAVSPVIALTTTNHGIRRTATISGAGNGGGLVNYPVRANWVDSGALVTTDNVFVFVNGVSVPCYANTSGAPTAAYVWFNVDTLSDGTSVLVEIVYDTGIDNPLCGLWDDGGMDVTAAINEAWVWDHWNMATHVRRPGSWNQIGTIDNYSSSTTRIPAGPANDAMALAVGAKAGSTNALTGLSRETTGHTTGSGAVSYVSFWTPGSTTPTIAWFTTANGTDTTSIDVDEAVRITIGCHLIDPSDTANTGKLTISGPATLDLVNTPTVSVGSAQTIDVYAGTITIGGDTITLDGVFVADGTLTIDCAAREITSSIEGGIIGLPDITFSNPDTWGRIDPGVNVVSSSLTGAESITYSYRDGFV